MTPSAERTAAAHWVEAGAARILLDCGAGTLHRAAQFGVAWPSMTHVAITHFHVDHWGELPHLVFAMRWGVEPARREPLTLIGPVGFRRRLEHLARGLGEWLLDPGYPLELVELDHGTALDLTDDVVLEAHATEHGDHSIAFAIRHGAVRLVYTGDTGPSDALSAWARHCSLLLAECSLPADRAIAIHLTPERAGTLARDAEAARLVLTHFYPSVERVDPAAIAGRIFAGPVVAAADGDAFTIEA